MKLVSVFVVFMLSGCGGQRAASGLKDLHQGPVGDVPVVSLGESVHIRQQVLISNGVTEVVVADSNCKIVARRVDNINKRTLDPQDGYIVTTRQYETDSEPMTVFFNNSNSPYALADFYMTCVRPSGNYSTEAAVIERIATVFQFDRFPRYNPGNAPIPPGSTPPPNNPVPGSATTAHTTCSGVHARCTYIGDSASAVYARSGCDVSDAMDKATTACLADHNHNCGLQQCTEF